MGLDIAIYNRRNKFLNSFRAGSYTFFGGFRDWICNIVISIKDEKIREIFFYFLYHSDCDGEIKFNKCKKLLKGFENDEFKRALFFEYLSDENKFFLEVLEKWKEGLKLAIKHRGYLIFC